MSRRETKERDVLYSAVRERRQVKMERSAMHRAWQIVQQKIADAEARVKEALARHEAEATPETRRRLLAEKMHLAALKARADRHWTI